MKAIKRTTLNSHACTGVKAGTSPAPVPVDLAPRRQLERTVSWTGSQRLRCLWYRIRLTVHEMNYATRRTIELQAPWISDDCTP